MTSDSKICDVIAADPQVASKQFRVTLAKCLVIAGIKNELDDPTISILWNYIKTTFGYSTFQEIEKAVFFNTAGKLDERIEHYQCFDLTFLSRVMELWLIAKTRTRQRISALLPPPKPETPPTPEDSYAGLVAYCQKNDSFPDYWSYALVYDHMFEKGMIPESKDERWDLYYAEVEKLTQKLELEILSADASDIKKRREEIPDTAKINCQRKLVQKYLSWK